VLTVLLDGIVWKKPPTLVDLRRKLDTQGVATVKEPAL
jgi:hypothetical protein